jgi:hypothetical protein
MKTIFQVHFRRKNEVRIDVGQESIGGSRKGFVS